MGGNLNKFYLKRSVTQTIADIQFAERPQVNLHKDAQNLLDKKYSGVG